MAVDAGLARLATLVLPPEAGLRRDRIVADAEAGPDFDARYDFGTLVYDAAFLPAERAVALVCPKLLNLERVLREGEIRLDDRPARLRRIRRYRRYEVALLPADRAPAALSLAWGGWRVETATPPPEDSEAFAGRNCLMTLSRNNDLRWIRDWAAYHVAEHGADAVLFFDNGSTDYAPGDVLDTLAGIEGMRVVRVVSAPMPYGGFPLRGARSRALFLQTGLWNAARLRLLARARAVLNCDVDELVLRHGPRGVFDATAASWGGFLSFAGEWRAHRAPPDRLPLHRDHVRLPARPGGCPNKYCIVPGGRLRRFSWDVHNLIRLPFSRMFETREFGYLHLHGISTRWKSASSRRVLEAGEVDAPTSDLLRRHFGAPDEDTAG